MMAYMLLGVYVGIGICYGIRLGFYAILGDEIAWVLLAFTSPVFWPLFLLYEWWHK